MTSRLMIVGCFCITALTVGTTGATAQDGKQPANVPAMFNLNLQLVRTDGSQIFIENDVPSPDGRKETKTYEVLVPVQQKVVKDGKEQTVITYRKETRTRITVARVRKSMPLPIDRYFTDRDGKELSKEKIIGLLGMGSGRYVVMLLPHQEVSAAMKKVFSKDTVFMNFKRVKPPAPVKD